MPTVKRYLQCCKCKTLQSIAEMHEIGNSYKVTTVCYECNHHEFRGVKPLFIPLKSTPYEAFLIGMKNYEFRLYGSRWNENTCRVGRTVTLSKGYGKQNRLTGVITSFQAKPLNQLNPMTNVMMAMYYENINAGTNIAIIGIKLIGEPPCTE